MPIRRAREPVKRIDDRRALRALHTDEMRQTADLLEPLIEPEQHRPVSDGDEDIVGHGAAELVIDLIRHALDPVDKERVIDMGGVVGIAERLLRHRHGMRTAIRHTDNVRSIRCNLLDTLR